MSLDPRHYVNLEAGRLGTQGLLRSTPADIVGIFDAFSASGTDTLVVHFHGGLVNERAGIAIAERLIPVYRGAGAYPVFFVWESGWYDVVRRNLGEIFAERVFRRLQRHVTRFVLGKLRQTPGVRGAEVDLVDEFTVRQELIRPSDGHEPFAAWNGRRLPADATLERTEEAQLRTLLAADVALADEAARIVAGLRDPVDVAHDRAATRGATVQGSTETKMSPEVLEEMRRESAGSGVRGEWLSLRLIKGAVAVAAATIARFASGRHHGVHATIVEELLREFYLANAGRAVWRLMKSDAADAFGPDRSVAGGSMFLSELAGALARRDTAPRLVLVGHSTGAICIAHLLGAADTTLPPDVAFDVVYLAPALSFADFAGTLANQRKRIADLRSFAMSDAAESRDALIPLLYPRSLLYLVSGLFEDDVDEPLVGMHRYFDLERFPPRKFPAVGTGRDYLTSDRVLWSPCDLGDGRRSGASAHAAFDDDPDTVASLVQILGRGFGNG
jgi:hypothetical protein